MAEVAPAPSTADLIRRGKLSGMDSLVHIMTSERTPMTEDVVFFYDPNQLNKDVLIRSLQVITKSHMRMRASIVKGRWAENPEWDIREHVVETTLALGESLESYISKHARSRLQADRPLWMMYIIHDSAGGEDALLTRVHHSIGDGLALIHLLDSFFAVEKELQQGTSISDKELADQMLHTAKTGAETLGARRTSQKKRRRKTFSTSAWLFAVIFSPIFLFYYSFKWLFMPKDRLSSLKHARSSASVEKSISWSEPIDIKEIKSVGVGLRATINDVIMACASLALRSYCLSKGETPSSVRIVVPVSVRNLYTTKVELDNRVSCVFMQLPLDEPDPVKVLRKCKKRMDVLKRSPDALIMYFFIKIMVFILPQSLCRRINASFYDKCTLTLTNIPGTKQKSSFAGGLVKTMVPFVPLVGDGQLGMACFSYGGQVNLSCLCDESQCLCAPRSRYCNSTQHVSCTWHHPDYWPRCLPTRLPRAEVIPDPHLLTESFVESFRSLRQSALNCTDMMR